MALDRIASSTSYAALDLVLAATANAPRLEAPAASAQVSTNAAADLMRVIADAGAAQQASDAFSQTSSALRARGDAIGNLVDVRA